MITLTLEPLTAEAFAPFGEVIEPRQRDSFLINGGQCRRFHRLATTETGAEGQAVISLFRPCPVTLPATLTLVERHPLGSQAFMPLAGQHWLAVVAPPREPPRPEHLRAFLANGATGVNYFAGTWHHPLLALDHGDFLVVDRQGPGANCDELPLTGVQVAK